MNLTKNFTLEELTRSPTAARLGLDNSPTPLAYQNLAKLFHEILQPLRDAYGQPIVINSGYRSPALNRAIGGAKNSQHMLGQAADIASPQPSPQERENHPDGNVPLEGGLRGANRRLFELIKELHLPFDQLIDEKNYSWIHVSFGPRNRRQVLHL